MFKNVLLGFSLLCGFLLPNHINAFASQPPLAYSWQTGDSDASAIVMPPLPTGYTYASIDSVATDAAGNAVMVGYASNADYTAQIALAYRLAYGANMATQITLPPLPAGATHGWISSVAINADGNAVMVGRAYNSRAMETATSITPLAYRIEDGKTEAKLITTPDLPDEYPRGYLRSVAINDDGNAVMVGVFIRPYPLSVTKENFLPFACILTPGADIATQITTPLPANQRTRRDILRCN